jgi:hypothetical protein
VLSKVVKVANESLIIGKLVYGNVGKNNRERGGFKIESVQ